MNDPGELVDLRHLLHSLAERSGEEVRTAAAIRDFLVRSAPDELMDGVGGQGIIACWKGNGAGPTIVLRCELDALPIPERNPVAWRSTDKQVSHKCGHDGHMAILCGVARYLGDHRPMNGTVCLLFQPAEETGQGARKMLETPELEQLHPDFIYALHNLPGYPRGTIISRDGIFAAASSGYVASFSGSTAHAAEPEKGNSPAPAMTHLIDALSAMPQYHIPIDQQAKVTVIHARMGEPAFGTSPSEAEVMATFRTFSEQLLDQLLGSARKVSEGLAETYGLELQTRLEERFPLTRNDSRAVEIIEKSATRARLDLVRRREPFSWSEDFGHFTARFPGAIFGLGSGEDQPPLHAADFDFPDDLLQPGVKVFTTILQEAGVALG